MNLAQFQIILQKINALDKNILMDGKISSIEKDLMKAYVSQLYEACVGEEIETPAQTSPQLAEPVQKTPPVQPEPVQNTSVTPVVQHNPEPVPTVVTPEPVVQQVVTPAAVPVEPTPVETPAPQAELKPQDLNDRIAANTKTVADKLAQPQAKSLNDRLANTQSNKTFNDKFTEPKVAQANYTAPKMVQIPDSLKHLDNSAQHSTPVTATPTPVTPPPAPTPQPTPTPVVNTTPVVTPVVTSGSININDIHALFDDSQADEAAGKWGSTPIQDISKSIGLNDKISMIKELFNDDHHAFNNSLTQLNSLGSYNEAKDYMMRNLVTVFKWNEGNKIERAKQLINLVRRRFK